MPYVSLYRKYRSQTFEDVMGQDHVIKTLQNAIRLGKVAHAYLFCGTRGTGKTTTARLLAKAMNCQSGPTPTPCNTCPSCKSVTEGSAMDIVELDAASHRSIRDIEEIRENVKFPPMELRYKVFIIDEAHQLSSDAKDAFLKTLEEPPAHAIFILATTEPQSIPVTIRSRCQQFDFRRGSLKDLKDRLRYVAENEGAGADDAALNLMAINADGSWRDGLSLLEQVLAYTDGAITVEDVNTVLGTVTQDFLFRITDILAEGDQAGAFEAAAEAVNSGKEMQQLLRSMAGHMRNLLFARVTKNADVLTTSTESAAQMQKQAAKFSKTALLQGVSIFTEAEKETRYSQAHRLLLELALLKMIEAAAEPARAASAQPLPVEKPMPERAHRQPEPVRPARETPQKAAPVIEKKQKTAEKETPAKADAGAHGKQNLPEFDKIYKKWNLVLQHTKSINITAYALLTDATPTELRDGAIVLKFKGEGQKNLLMNESGKAPKKQALLTALERVFGVANAGIICEVLEPEQAAAVKPEPEAAPVEDVQGQETLANVLDMFGGEIVN